MQIDTSGATERMSLSCQARAVDKKTQGKIHGLVKDALNYGNVTCLPVTFCYFSCNK